jgi:hypothetical protein
VILIADNTKKAIAFKNLRVTTLDDPLQPSLEKNEKAAIEHKMLILYIAVIILLTVIFAAGSYKKRGFRMLTTRNSNT